MPEINSRAGNRWTIPEVLSLQREHELLELGVEEIAKRHGRSVLAIIWRLELEGFCPPSSSSFLR